MPAVVRAEQGRQTEVIKPLDYRQVVISNIKLTIPRNFLTMSSATEPNNEAKALTLAFTYPEIQGGYGNDKNFVSLWFEDVREYSKACSNTVKEMQASLKDKDNNREFKERKIFNQIDAARNKMIEEYIQEKVPFYLQFIFYNNFIQCDPDNMIPQAFCELVIFYKELYILIRFKKDFLNKLSHIEYCVLQLIKQWEEQ